MGDIDEGEVRGRISELVKNVGGPSAAARLLEMSREQVSKWSSGDARPPLLAIAKMCDAADTSLDWIVFGAPFQPSLSARVGVPARGGDVVRLPMFDVQASAGPGARNDAPRIVEKLPFSKSLLDQLSIREGKAHVIRARGDSMEPTISDGAIVLIDTSYTRVKDDGIYALVIGDDVRIKRVAKGWQGALQLLSDNDRYQMEQLSPPDAEGLQVAGKVVWAGGEI